MLGFDLRHPHHRSWMVALLLMSTPWSITGCWDYNELDREAIISVLAYDISEQGKPLVTASVEVYGHGNQGSSSSANQPADILVHAKGASFYEALQNLSEYIPDKLNYYHHTVSVFSVRVASSKNFIDELDSITRSSQAHRRDLKFIVSGRSADVLKASTIVPGELGAVLPRLSDQYLELQKSIRIDLNEFMYDLSTPGIDPIIPRLIILKGNREQKVNKQGTGILQLNGAAAFRKGRFAGWLSGAEIVGVIFIRGQSGHTPLHFYRHGKLIVVKTKTLSTQVIPLKSTSKGFAPPAFLIRLQWTGGVVQYPLSQTPDVTVLPVLEQSIKQQIETILRNSITRAQILKSDVLGFGNALYCADPKRYRAYALHGWDETTFPHVRYKFNITATLLDTGMTSVPVKSRN